MKIPSLLLIATALSFAGTPVRADSFFFFSDTTGANGFNRPTEPGDALSEIGTDVPFYAQSFTVSLSGNYNFTAVANEPANFDTFIHLYTPSFAPGAPLNNVVAANDDAVNGDSTAGSAISGQPLVAGNTYVFIIDGFANSDFGGFSANISGPGAVSPVPEPSALALAGGGFAGLWLLRWRKSARR